MVMPFMGTPTYVAPSTEDSAGTSGFSGFLGNLGNLGSAVGGFLGGQGGRLLGAGLSIDELNKITEIAEKSAEEQAKIGQQAQEDVAFKPFTVTTGFGGVAATPEGGFTTTLSPSQVAQQQQLQAITGGLLGGMGATLPDVSGIQQQALEGAGGFLTGTMMPTAQREADVYERIRATQRPAEERARLALEERLASQGRTGLRTAMFGGSPEQLALAQAQEEAKARASLSAIQQAQAEQYAPEQQLLASLTPAISIADLARTGQQLGAQTRAEASISGLEDLLQAETVRSQNLRDIYSSILGAQAAQTAASGGGSGGSGGMVDDILSIGSALAKFF